MGKLVSTGINGILLLQHAAHGAMFFIMPKETFILAGAPANAFTNPVNGNPHVPYFATNYSGERVFLYCTSIAGLSELSACLMLVGWYFGSFSSSKTTTTTTTTTTLRDICQISLCIHLVQAVVMSRGIQDLNHHYHRTSSKEAYGEVGLTPQHHEGFQFAGLACVGQAFASIIAFLALPYESTSESNSESTSKPTQNNNNENSSGLFSMVLYLLSLTLMVLGLASITNPEDVLEFTPRWSTLGGFTPTGKQAFLTVGQDMGIYLLLMGMILPNMLYRKSDASLGKFVSGISLGFFLIGHTIANAKLAQDLEDLSFKDEKYLRDVRIRGAFMAVTSFLLLYSAKVVMSQKRKVE